MDQVKYVEGSPKILLGLLMIILFHIWPIHNLEALKSSHPELILHMT